MKKSDIYDVAINKIIRNKQNVYYIPILILALLLLIVSLMISKNINLFIDKSQNNNVGFRTLNIPPNYNEKDYGYELLKHTDNIVEIYSSKYSGTTLESNLKNKKVNGKIGLFYGSKNTLPKVEIGTNLDEDSDGYAICPIQFFPDDRINDLKIDPKYILSPSESLNKEFEVYYNSYTLSGNSINIKKTYTKKFKIIGLYDNRKILNMNNECFISTNDIKQIMDTIYSGLDDDTLYSHYAIVNELKNVNKTISFLEYKGFSDITPKLTIDKAFFNTILISSKTTMIIVSIIVIIVTSFYSKKKMLNEEKNIGIYKALGFSNLNIFTIYLTEMVVINIFCFVMSYFIYILLFYYLKNYYFTSLKFIGIDIVNFKYFYIAAFMIVIIISVMVTIVDLYKKLKINAVDLIGSDELWYLKDL